MSGISKTKSVRLSKRDFSSRKRALAGAAGAALMAAVAPAAMAATYTYTAPNSTTSNTWSSGTAWTGATAPVSAADTTLVFAGAFTSGVTATSQDNIGGAFQLNVMTLNASNSQTFSTATYNVSPTVPATNTLNFTNNLATTAVVNLNGSNGGFGANVSYAVSLNATIDGGSLTFQGNGSSTFNFSGILSNGSTTASVTKTGSSTLTFSGNNTFGGGLTLNQGGLNINHASALGSGTFTMSSGVKIDNTSGSAINTSTNNNAQIWNGGFTWGGTAALNLGTGGVTLGANTLISVNGAGALTVGGNLTDGAGTFGLTLGVVGSRNTGTLILNGASNTYDGPTVINSGFLQIASAPSGSGANVTVNSFGALATSYALDQTTLARLTTSSTGTIALAASSSNNLDFSASGANLGVSLGAIGNFTYSGTLTPQGTTYRLGGAGGNLTLTNALTGSNSLEIGDGGSAGTVTFNAAGTYNGGTIVNGVPGGTASVLQTNILTGVSNTPFGSSGSSITLNNGTLGLGTVATLASGNVMNVTGYDLTFDTGNLKLTVGSGTSVTFNANSLNQSSLGGVLYIVPSSATSLGLTEKVLVANASSTIPLTTTNGMIAPNIIDSTNKKFLTYSASNGLVTAVSTSTFGKNNIVSVGADPNTTLSAYAFITNTGLGASDNLTLGAGGFLSTGSQNNAAGTINFGSTPGFYANYGGGAILTNFNATAGVTFYGTGSGLSQVGLNISGGITFASGSWTFTPQPTGSELFQTANPNPLILLSGATITEQQGSKMTFASIQGSGTIVESAGNIFTLTINGLNTTGTTTFNGPILGVANGVGVSAGAGNVVKTGTNTQVFAGANSYNGTTSANGGTLRGTQTSGTPFGLGSIGLSGGILALAPSGSGANVAVTGANVASNSTFAFGPASQLVLDKGGNTSLSFTVGNTAATANSVLVRNANGTLIVAPASGSANLGTATGEKFIVNGGATTTNGIVNAAIIGQDASGNRDGTFLGYDATNGLVTGTYSDTNFAAAASTSVEDVTSTTSVNSQTVFALRTSAALTLNASQTLTVGSNSASVPAGVILNGGSITGGTALAFGAAPGVIYSNTAGGTIASAITGSAGVSIVGPGATTLSPTTSSYSGGTNVNNSTLIISNNGNLGTALGAVALNGGTLQSTATIDLGTRAISLGIGQTNYGGVFDVASATTLTAQGVLSGTGGLIKNNTGVLTLKGVNTFTGFTVVNGGTLRLASSTALQNSVLTTNGTIFDVASGSLNASIGGLSGSFDLSLLRSDAAAMNVSVGNALIPNTYSGALTGALGNLIKVGTSSLTLTGASTYTGKTSIQGGTLTVNSLNSVSGGSASSSLGAPVTVANGTIAIGVAGTAGTLTYQGTGETTDRVIDLSGTTGGATLNANGTGALVFSSNLTATGAGAKTLTLAGSSDPSVNNNIQGAIVDSASATSVTKSGFNTWVLSGNNSYTGLTTVGTQGTLKLGATGSAGNGPLGTTTAGTTVSSGGTLDLNGFTLANSEALTLNGNGVSVGTSSAGALTNNSVNSANYSGLVTLGAASKILAVGDINLTNAGTITGATFGLTLDGTSTNSSVASIIGTTSGGITKAGSGTWTLTGANTNTGTTTINYGTLNVGNGTSGSLNGSTGTALTFGGTGTFNVQEAASSTQGMAALSASAGEGTVQSTFNATSATLTFSNATRTAGAAANFISSGGTNGTTNKIVLTQFGGVTTPTGTLLDRGVFFNGSTYASYDSTGFVRAYGAGDAAYLAAPTAATIGASTATSNVELTTGNITAQTTVSANTINLGANNLVLSTSAQVLSANGLLSSGSSSATLGSTGGKLQPATASAEMVVRVNGSSDKLTIGAIIQNNTGASALTKSGAGTLELSSGVTSTYTGATTVDAGQLTVNGSIATSAVTVRNTAILGGGGTAGAVTINTGGTIAPGNSIGTINTGALTLNGNFNAEIDMATNGVTGNSSAGTIVSNAADLISVTGTVNLSNATLNLSLLNATPGPNGNTYVLILNDGGDAVSGTFASIIPPVVGNLVYSINYTYNANGGGANDVAITFTSVPEPTSLGLIGLAGAGMLARRRRSRKAESLMN